MSAPKRAFELEMKVGGDTLEDLMSTFLDFVDHIEATGKSCVHGGPSSGGFFEIKHDPTMTHDRYIELLEKHLDEREKNP